MTKRKQLETLLEIEAEAREKIRSLRRELRLQQQKNDELESKISALICVNEALSPKTENEEHKERARKAEEECRYYKKLCDKFLVLNRELRNEIAAEKNKLSARDSADKTFKDNCCFGLSFLGETLRELNKQDEEQKRRENFLFRAVEGLAGANAELKRQLGEEPSKAITIDGTRADSKTKQPEPKKKKA